MINEDLLKVINEYTKFTHDTNINKKQIVEELSSLVFIEDDELLLENIDYFFDFINIKRENCWSFNKIQDNAEELIKHVENKEQPEQRTDEWYKYRYNMLTASSIWKIFKSESTRKELIKNKKEPLNLDKYKKVNTESPLHWGHKYEPISVLIYEKRSIVMSERDKELYETMFNKLSPVEFMKIIKIGTWASSKPGDILIKQDNDVNSLRLIYSGNVNIEIDGKIVSELKDGNFIGEMSFLTEHKASATVTAKHETECLTWKQEELKILLKRNPSLYFSIQSMLSSQVSMALISSSKKQAS